MVRHTAAAPLAVFWFVCFLNHVQLLQGIFVRLRRLSRESTVPHTQYGRQFWIPVISDDRSNDVDGETVATSQRRNHHNKYAHLAGDSVDPLVEAIRRAKRHAQRENTDLSSPVRGTTVPTLLASPHVPRNGTKSGTTEARTKRRRLLRNTKSIKLKKFQQGKVSLDDVVPSDPYTFGFVRIGRILGAHGVKGEVKAQLQSDFLDLRIKAQSVIYVKKPNRRSPRAVRVIASRPQSDNLFLLRFEHISNRLGAAAFKQYEVYVRSSDRPTLTTGEYLIRDIVGMQCFLIGEDKAVAVVVGVVPADELCGNTAAKLMHAQLELQLLHRGPITQLCMIPLVPEIVKTVDISAQCMIIDPPVGLLDLTYQPPRKKRIVRGLLPQTAVHVTDTERRYLKFRTSLKFAEGGEYTEPPQLFL